MKNTLALVFLFSVLLFSCAKNDCKINLVSEKVEGLDTDAIVTIHGFQVGEVEKVEPINNDKVNIQIGLHRDPAIPADSKFRIENMDFLEPKELRLNWVQKRNHRVGR
ncbi:MAG: MlaD family protein [Saprospiraceae bacterium]